MDAQAGERVHQETPDIAESSFIDTQPPANDDDVGSKPHTTFADTDPSKLEEGRHVVNGTDVSEDGSDNIPKEEEADPNHLDERSRLKTVLLMFALCMAVFLAALDITIITTSLETISDYFHSTAGFTWIGAAYLLATAASTPIWGKVSDIFGRKPMLLIANFLFFVGSLIAALSINIGMLIAARAIQGLGGGGLVVLVNIVIGDLFSPRRRGAYYGVIGGVWALASSLGPIIGGAFTTKVTWRWCFYINLPLDGLAFVIILFFLDLKTPTTPVLKGLATIDWLGAFFIVTGTLLFLFGLEYGGTSFPWDSATVLSLLIIGIACIGAFAFIELKVAKYPIMPARIFKYRSNIAALGLCFFHSFTFIAGSYYLPLYFQAVLGVSPLISGVYTLATSVSLSIASIATGIFIRKTGLFLPPIYFGVFFMTLGFGLYINLGVKRDLAKIIIFQVIAGLGVGPLFQAPLIALQSRVSPRDIATATGTFGFTRNIGTAISVVVGGVIFQNEIQKGGQSSSGSGLASIDIIGGLPPAQRGMVRSVFASALSKMWILYVCTAAVAIVFALLIGQNTLSKQHEETKTGLAAQEETRLEAIRAKEEKAARKSLDVRKSTDEKDPQMKNGWRKSLGGKPKASEDQAGKESV